MKQPIEAYETNHEPQRIDYGLILTQDDYALMDEEEMRKLKSIVTEINTRRREYGLNLIQENKYAVFSAQNETDKTMPNFSSNQKIQAYESYIKAKGDDPYDVLHGRNKPESGESSDMKAADAIEVIKTMSDTDTIQEYTKKEERKTVLKAAEERLVELTPAGKDAGKDAGAEILDTADTNPDTDENI